MTIAKDGGQAGKIILYSPRDQLLVASHQWRIGSNGYVYLAGARVKDTPCLLHRILLGVLPGQEVHHKNGNKLDNRRENLEITTAKDHQDHHKHIVIARNKASRIHPLSGVCKKCGKEYTKDRDHRGRQTCCSKLCAILLAAKKSQEARNAKR